MRIDFIVPRVLVCLGLLLATFPRAAYADEKSGSARDLDIRRRRDTQQQIREQSRALLMHVVDVQLQNLEENGLQELPIYREIQSMRLNVDRLVDGEMQHVVDLLEEVHGAAAEDSIESHARIREMARGIVAQLMAERQRITRRLKSTELQSGARRLIDAQERTAGQTAQLKELPPDRQETEVHSAVEAQRDVRQRFLHLESTLRDASQWRGEAGAVATAALRELEEARSDQEFEQAIAALENLEPHKAGEHQQRLLQSFRKIADRLASPSKTGADASRRKPETVERLREAQSAIRDKTRELVPDSPEADNPEIDALVESQTEVRRQLGELATQFPDNSESRQALDEAKAAADSSRRALFEGDRDQALEHQERILSALEQAGKGLDSAESASPTAQSARQAIASVGQLEDLARKMTDVARRQGDVSKQTKSAPGPSQRAESQIAAELQEAASQKDLPLEVSARLTSAGEAAATAAKALEEPDDTERNQRAVNNADRAVERAAAEAQAALKDAKRRALAIKAGELSRAAEAMDRAAAAQRDVADALQDAARSGEISADAAQDLAERERQFQAVAGKVAEGAADAGSSKTDLARESHEAVNAAEQAVSKMAAAETPDKKSAAEALNRANDAARSLSQTAGALRQEVEALAQSLAEEASRQANEVAAAREAVEREIENAPVAEASKAQGIASARKKLGEAQTEQSRAAGRPRAARMRELRESIQEALDRQAASGSTAERASGNRATMGEAVESQQATAKQIADLATQVRAADESLTNAAKALDQASRAGERAARAMLDGNAKAADLNRRAAEESLQQALADAERQLSAAEKQPAGERDAAAQRRATDALSEARKITAPEAGRIEESLAEAEQASKQAAEKMREGDAEAAESAQEKTEESLEEADSRIQEFLQEATEQLPQQLTEDARRAGLLAEQAAPDPEALSALREAEQTAREIPGEPGERVANQLQARALMQQAAQSLAAREQAIRRDETAARSMAQAATRQSEAFQEIAESRAELTQEPRPDPESENTNDPMTPSEEDQTAMAEAGRRLTAASEQFAEAQRGTGKRAEEMAGQSQIASSPLQEALEMASRLGEGTMAGTGAQGQTAGQDSSTGSDAGSGRASGNGGSMGTGFVPDSPEATARMLAGAKALKKAAAAGAGGSSSEEGDEASSGQASKSGRPGSKSGSSSDSGEQGPDADGPGSSAGRGAGSAQAASAPGSREGDIDPSAIPAPKEEPWLLKLPPETRKAIRARAQRPPPRSYEERLKRYFESVR